MKYLIIEDDCNLDDFVVREDGKTMYVRGMLRILSQPHKEKNQIAIICYGDCENNPEAEPWMFNFIDGTRIEELTSEEFNKLWELAYSITGNN